MDYGRELTIIQEICSLNRFRAFTTYATEVLSLILTSLNIAYIKLKKTIIWISKRKITWLIIFEFRVNKISGLKV